MNDPHLIAIVTHNGGVTDSMDLSDEYRVIRITELHDS